MKVVILAGGKGTRIAEESQYKPKPMIMIGNKPIIWHIMKYYSHFNFKYLEQHILILWYQFQSLIYYGTPLHLHKASKYLGYKKGDFPNVENLCSKVLALPHHQHLKEKEIKYVCDEINKFYSK